MLKFGRLKPEHRTEYILLTARAMENYAYVANYIPDSVRRRRFLECAMDIEVRLNAEHSVLLTASEGQKIVAAAMLCPPAVRRPGALAYLRAGFWRALRCGGICNVLAWAAMDDKAGAPCHHYPGAAWYLSMLAVDPAYQGRGVGSRFLQACIIPAVKKRGGETLCLFTNSEENRVFYQKNGFREFDAREFRYHGKTLGSWSYCMNLRD